MTWHGANSPDMLRPAG